MRTICCIQPSPRICSPPSWWCIYLDSLLCHALPTPAALLAEQPPPSRHAHVRRKLLVEPHYSHQTSCWITPYKRLILTSPTHWSTSFRSRISTLYGTVGEFRTQTRIAVVSPKLSHGVASTNHTHPANRRPHASPHQDWQMRPSSSCAPEEVASVSLQCTLRQPFQQRRALRLAMEAVGFT